jgi:type VI secretion system secreted protein Hcp
MRSAFRAVFLFLALLAVSEAFAQQTILFSVGGWPRISTRDDGKANANAFTWGVSAPVSAAAGAGGGAGKASVQDSVLVFPIGDAAVLFAQAAMRGQRLPMVLVEFPSAKAKPGSAAPFAVRLSDVLVTSVSLSKSGADGGPGAAEVKLNASRIELFVTDQDNTGAPRPGAKAGYDVRSGKAM